MTRLAPLLVLLVVLAGCGSSSGGATQPSDEPSSGTSAPAPTETVDEAGSAATAAPETKTDEVRVPEELDFTATTVSGDTFEASRLAGKPVVFWFWAPWCPTCRAQAPAVQSLAKKYGDEVAVVGVGGLDEQSAISEYAEQVTGFTQLVDPEGAVWRRLGVTAQSTYLVLDSEGETVDKGYLDDGDLVDVVDELAG